ncbi:Na+/H+ antiporter, subunit MnhF [Thermogladius calderae 1633]|uniref:Na+/H+ antiporter, subunit MnhF n=1 Tax=Thermogladius calderae (strain DSM 22663 / VKM B-2946 / 1633) TaxID=1184251 RepID=I3TG08_THEC1|nr:monovalent cation/H+ antiporter complex subunit F [Thermogladius calderae]AFK51696.1 Na+/H+ antiporter, subunit MnhF [Thermogladius calderae 1633]
MFVQEFIAAVIPLYLVATVLYLYRALKGPTIPDHVLGVDLLSYNLAVLFIVLGIFFEEPILIVTAIPLALWIYALDIYVAKYLERKVMGA